MKKDKKELNHKYENVQRTYSELETTYKKVMALG